MTTAVPPAMTKKFKIIDLFAGPGGLDLAARQLGVDATGIEFDRDACATRLANGLHTVEGEPRDVRKYCPDDFSDCNVLAGGPPCQTFTVAGSGSGRRALEEVLNLADKYHAASAPETLEALRANSNSFEDERTGLVLEPLWWALQALRGGRPYQAIVLEQVPAVLPVWKKYAEILRKEGYAVASPRVLHTEEYGVPQTRRRAILIARWAGPNRLLAGDPSLPPHTHHSYHKSRPRESHVPGIKPWVAMEDVLTERRGTGKFQVVSNYGTGGDPRARGIRRSDEPSATVTSKITRNRVVSPSGDELDRFSDWEAGQLQTFPIPPHWTWKGNAVAQQIGNAVPPLLGVHVFAAALDLGSGWRNEAIDRWHPYAEPERGLLGV
ncbi:DNA cytosine methyltransferase [Streptomyces sioyaensis]|uniref:DNA cytosine methyltransferase n=1 Tax=Streptomyces sioyaensis TaxID=67364 RepID=UPI0034036E3D